MAVARKRSVVAEQSGAGTQAESAGETIDQAEVARVAYELYMQRGGVHGHDREDWLRAEVIVRQRAAGKRRSRPTVSAAAAL